MEMKQFLLETFLFNDQANCQMIRKIEQLPDRNEAIRYISHLINSQKKWMARILQDPAAPQMSWWDPVYDFDTLEQEWKKSLAEWTRFLESKTESEILEEVTFTGFDGGRWSARLLDIALQLNFHSIHHRAQMQLDIRKQGIEPDFIDYIGTKYKKLSD